MGDPLSDPRAQHLLAADTGEVGALAAAFRRVADQAQTAAAGLRGAQNDATWTGEAATAFRHQLGQLPGDLDKVQHSYGEVATALDGYGAQLGPIQSQFRSIAGQLSTARSNLSGAQGQLSSARTNLTSATAAPHATSTTPAVVDAHTAVSNAAGAVGRLSGEVSGLEGRGFALLDEFDTVRGHARSTVSSAAGIAPSESWLSGALGTIGNFMSGTGHFFAGLGTGVWNAATSLPSDVNNIIEHPGSLEAWSKALGDVGKVVGAVALIAAVVAFPADLVGLEAVAAVAEGTASFAEGAGLVNNVLKTGVDTGALAEGKGSLTSVEGDVVGLVASGIQPGKAAATSEVDMLATKSAGLESFGLSRALGATPRQAYADLSAEQRLVLTNSVSKLGNPGRLSYMRSSTTAQLDQATLNLSKIKTANSVGHYVFDGVKDQVFPEPKPAGAGG